MSKKLLHDQVYTRLMPSPIHGVGVFAICDIPKGTNIFSNDEGEMVWIDKSEIDKIEPDFKKLYEDFCVIKNGKYGCPKNFNSLTVAWYLNESKTNPNVLCDKDYNFITTREIKQGEELTVDYSTYSEQPYAVKDSDEKISKKINLDSLKKDQDGDILNGNEDEVLDQADESDIDDLEL